MSEKHRRGPPPIPPEERFKRWNVTLPPELDLRLQLLLKDDSQASKSELLTKLLETHPTVRAVQLPPPHAGQKEEGKMRRIDTPFGMVEIRDERRGGAVYTIGGEDYEAHDGLQRVHRRLNGSEISDPLVMAAIRVAVASYDHRFYLACRRSGTWTPNEYDALADARAHARQAEARVVWG